MFFCAPFQNNARVALNHKCVSSWSYSSIASSMFSKNHVRTPHLWCRIGRCVLVILSVSECLCTALCAQQTAARFRGLVGEMSPPTETSFRTRMQGRSPQRGVDEGSSFAFARTPVGGTGGCAIGRGGGGLSVMRRTLLRWQDSIRKRVRWGATRAVAARVPCGGMRITSV